MKNERNEMSIQILNMLIDSLVSIALKSTNDNYCRMMNLSSLSIWTLRSTIFLLISNFLSNP